VNIDFISYRVGHDCHLERIARYCDLRNGGINNSIVHIGNFQAVINTGSREACEFIGGLISRRGFVSDCFNRLYAAEMNAVNASLYFILPDTFIDIGGPFQLGISIKIFSRKIQI
jgi:hypothetical protein